MLCTYVYVSERAWLSLNYCSSSVLGLPWRLFSESSRSVMLLLFKIVTSIYGKDLVRNVFQEDHFKVCRPCLRRLDRISREPAFASGAVRCIPNS